MGSKQGKQDTKETALAVNKDYKEYYDRKLFAY